ncbi:MAG: hypothetical protein WDN26_08950 [Chitinophagaceae bacterium]
MKNRAKQRLLLNTTTRREWLPNKLDDIKVELKDLYKEMSLAYQRKKIFQTPISIGRSTAI